MMVALAVRRHIRRRVYMAGHDKSQPKEHQLISFPPKQSVVPWKSYHVKYAKVLQQMADLGEGWREKGKV